MINLDYTFAGNLFPRERQGSLVRSTLTERVTRRNVTFAFAYNFHFRTPESMCIASCKYESATVNEEEKYYSAEGVMSSAKPE